MAFLEDDFQPLFVAVRDGMHHDIASTFPAFFDFAARARFPGKLLVHCEKGVSRSATLAIALLMTSERLTFFEAYSAVRSRRAGVLPNIGFASQLQRLERDLHLGPGAERSSLPGARPGGDGATCFKEL